MRRLVSAVAALGVSGVLLFAGAPAHAVEPPPPPVQPIPGLPSTTQKGLTSAGGIGDSVVARMAWYRQTVAAMNAAASAASPAAVAASKAVPITGTRLLAAGAGGPVTAAFMAGWLLTDGTLSMYGTVTGSSPMDGTCGQPDWAISTIQLLYPFSAPSCKVTYTSPNDGIEVGLGSLTYGGFSAAYLYRKVLPGGSSYDQFCYTVTGSAPTGYEVQIHKKDGSWGPGMPSPGWTGPWNCATSEHEVSAWRADAPSYTTHADNPALRLVHTATGSVVGIMAETTADPGRVPSCQLTWPDGSITTTEGDPYTEANGFPWSDASALCNDGFVSKPGHGPDLLPTEIEIGSTRQDTGDYSEVQNQPVPEFTEDEKKGLTAPSPGGGLVLQKVIGTTTSSCMNWDADCAGWWPATDEGTAPSTTTGTYRCTYNGSTVDLAECGIYRFTFDTKTSTPTVTDPDTGLQTPWVSGAANPSNSINPGTGPGTSPGDTCMSSWPSAPDPLSWVLHPVKCALVWAFVPRQSAVQSAQGRMQDGVDNSVVGTVGAALGTLGGAFDAGVGCGGLPFHLEAFGHVLVHTMLLESCTEPAAGIAATVRTVLSVVIIGGGIMAFTRYLGSLFGFQSFGRNNSENKQASGVSFE